MKTTLAAMASLITLATAAASRADNIRGPGKNFDAEVAPILARRCLDCHAGPAPKGKLDLSSRASALGGGEDGPAIVPGKPDESPLWARIVAGEMPPDSPLPEAEKAALRRWIVAGASWGTDPIDPYQVTTTRRAGRDWWSLQTVRRPASPATRLAGWVRNPIDAFVLRKLEENGLAPAPDADRRSLVRRVSFDLTGLPPTPEEINTFASDRSPDAYERLVDRYLASPQYGVRWARWWLDLARFGESDGFEFDEFRPAAWRYRDWVVWSFNRDRPYNEFAALQIAGDALRPEYFRAIEATGFLVAGAYDRVGQEQISEAMKAVVRGDEIEDLVGTVGQAFLGLTVNCARCHDHKFDPIRQVEYYRIASALSGVRRGERDLTGYTPETIELSRKIDDLNAKLIAIEVPARKKVVAAIKAVAKPVPAALAAWDFDKGPDDLVSGMSVKLQGGATLSSDGLRLDGKTGFAKAHPLDHVPKSRTIEAWVKLDNLDQRGGGVIGIETPDGALFDTLVFGEREPGRWMAGSEAFRRTKDVGGQAETEAVTRPVHVAITYAEDGTTRIYRDGRPYGTPYKSSGPIDYPARGAQVFFGLRHAPASSGRLLAGTIVRARLYDRALDPAEVSASATGFDYVDADTLAKSLPDDRRAERAGLIREIAAIRSELAARPHKAFVATPRETSPTRLQIRGNPAQPGEVARPGAVAAVTGPEADFGLPPDAPEGERRKRLAVWITDARNPMFSRVIVNRLWQAHFGAGLVETPSDLGFNGGVPSHPELLDWLASEMVARGWSLKAMHRLIVTSASYRQSSRIDPMAMKRDAADRLLWRKAPTRLEAEMVRDAMLAVSGTLDATLGGPSFRDHEAIKAAGTAAILYVASDPAKPGLNRRTLYRAWARGGRSSLLDVFDCPDPSTAAPRRPVTTTPLQALALMNNALTLHLSDAFAARLKREAGDDAGRQVDRAYRLALGREPSRGERTRAVGVVERFGAATLARAIFNSNEFLYID